MLQEPPRHTAIIMDGNGRWASARGLPRKAGHRQGAKAVERVVRGAPDLGIRILTLYAFSADNWKRPPREVETLMDLLEKFLRTKQSMCEQEGVRLCVIGRRDRLRPSIVDAIVQAESSTKNGDRLHLRLAVDYSAREAIMSAASQLDPGKPDPEAFARHLNRVIHSVPSVPDVDLLIRTGGEKRLSDFLLWESAYAELVFSDRMWPEFGMEDLELAVADYDLRNRRFGSLPPPQPKSWAARPFKIAAQAAAAE